MIAPIEIGKSTILASTTYGVKAYRLTKSQPKLIWESNRIRAQVGNLIYLPDQEMIIGATGASTGSPIVALDLMLTSNAGGFIFGDRKVWETWFITGSVIAMFSTEPSRTL